MQIEVITDEKYEQFRQAVPAVLVVVANGCLLCAAYLPVVESLADKLSQVKFGGIVAELDSEPPTISSLSFYNEFKNIISGDRGISFPTTMIFRRPSELTFFRGPYGSDDASDMITGVLNRDETLLASYRDLEILHQVNLGFIGNLQ